MDLHAVDVTIILLYMAGVVAIGFLVAGRAGSGIRHYFLGGREVPWWALSMSNAASMFDISGTIWLVSLLYVYGLSSVFIPWLWPVFNQIFLMVYLSVWLRRSGVITGAEWITLRFGHDRGAEASRISVVLFALVSVIAFTGYAFVGIGKFAEIFLPDTFSPNTYALIIIGITTLYTVLGGMYSVVLTDVLQFLMMVVCSVALGLIAMQRVSPEMLAAVVPEGWTDISFGWVLDLEWTELMPAAAEQMGQDGYTMFGAFFMMMVLKGVLVSAAGPAPNYDMQRILAARSPKEAAMMSGLVTVVLYVPRYFMIAGITVLALAFMSVGEVTDPTGAVDSEAEAGGIDLEQVLPIVIRDFVPVGLAGLLVAGLLAAFMSTFSSTINAAAAYLVNDVYKRYARPEAAQREYVRASYLAAVAIVVVGCAAGFLTPTVAGAVNWIVSGLWGGYAAANILKWYWWRLNGWGYFWGMLTGIGGALLMLIPSIREAMAAPIVKLISVGYGTPAESADLDLMAFPMLLLFSLFGTVAGSLLSRPEREEVLVEFYTRTRPWGWWGPVRAAALRRDRRFEPNRNFRWDVLNIVVGIVWQTAFVAMPIYAVIRDWGGTTACLAIILITSAILKHTWYDRLERTEPAAS